MIPTATTAAPNNGSSIGPVPTTTAVAPPQPAIMQEVQAPRVTVLYASPQESRCCYQNSPHDPPSVRQARSWAIILLIVELLCVLFTLVNLVFFQLITLTLVFIPCCVIACCQKSPQHFLTQAKFVTIGGFFHMLCVISALLWSYGDWPAWIFNAQAAVYCYFSRKSSIKAARDLHWVGRGGGGGVQVIVHNAPPVNTQGVSIAYPQAVGGPVDVVLPVTEVIPQYHQLANVNYQPQVVVQADHQRQQQHQLQQDEELRSKIVQW